MNDQGHIFKYSRFKKKLEQKAYGFPTDYMYNNILTFKCKIETQQEKHGRILTKNDKIDNSRLSSENLDLNSKCALSHDLVSEKFTTKMKTISKLWHAYS